MSLRSVIKRFIWTKWTGSNLNEKSNPLKGVTLRDFQISDILLSCSIFIFLFLTIDLFNTSMLPCVCSVIDHRSGNDKNVAHEAIAECITEVLTTFWRLLWFVTEQTHGNIESKALSTLIRFQTKTELFCSVFKKICVHTYRFRIVFARPHYNAVFVLKTLLYPQCACSNQLDACAFQYIGQRNWREIEARW